MSDVAIVDYGINNVRSVRNAVEYCGFDPIVTHDADAIADASHVILPGVGAFGDAMINIRARGIDELLERHVREKGKPFLAVCLGMQLLANSPPKSMPMTACCIAGSAGSTPTSCG